MAWYTFNMTKNELPGQTITVPTTASGLKVEKRMMVTQIDEWGWIHGYYLRKDGKPSGSHSGGIPQYKFSPESLGF